MVRMALKALLCSGDDESPQYQSVLGAIHTLNSPKNYTRLLGGLLPICLTRGAQGLMGGTRGPFFAGGGHGRLWLCWSMLAVEGLRQVDLL